jgi:hypothetical protein
LRVRLQEGAGAQLSTNSCGKPTTREAQIEVGFAASSNRLPRDAILRLEFKRHPMKINVSVPPKVVLVPTPVTAEQTTQVKSVSFGSGGLIVAMSSEHWVAKVSFFQSYGFRVLDELDLTEFWSQCSLAEGWLFEVISGGWKDLEKQREHFYSGRHVWVREYLVVGFNECVSILSKEEPVFEVKSLRGSSTKSSL